MKRLAPLLAAAVLSSGCAGVYDRAETYTARKLEPLAGASVGVEFVPTQSDSAFGISAMVLVAAESKSRGPYRLAVFAVGEPREHLRMDVTSLRISTPDGKFWDIPQERLETGVLFMAARDGARAQATFLVPMLLAFDFDRYAVATVTAGVTLHLADGTKAARVCVFTCDRENKKTWQSWFLPAEIVNSVRMNDVPLEHMDVGANKPGWRSP
jgi:hypothetical protein